MRATIYSRGSVERALLAISQLVNKDSFVAGMARSHLHGNDRMGTPAPGCHE